MLVILILAFRGFYVYYKNIIYPMMNTQYHFVCFQHSTVENCIFNDLVGDPHAFYEGRSAISNLCIEHKHLQCTLQLTTQYI